MVGEIWDDETMMVSSEIRDDQKSKTNQKSIKPQNKFGKWDPIIQVPNPPILTPPNEILFLSNK